MLKPSLLRPTKILLLHLANREAEEIAVVAERAAEEARQNARNEAAEAAAMAYKVIDDKGFQTS